MKGKFQDEVFNIHYFKPNVKEYQKIDEFKQRTLKHFGEYGTFRYIFTPTEKGNIIIIESVISGYKEDVTDYESWLK
jgi:hypothetical protein